MISTPRVKEGLEVECFSCRTSHDPHALQSTCTVCGRPLRVKLPLPDVTLNEVVDQSVASMWRYADLLAVRPDDRISLGEGWTPITEVRTSVFVKDESINPTGSFKDRGMSMAVSAAVLLGVERLVAPSAGNAGAALSAYGQKAGISVLVAMPADTPARIIQMCIERDADVQLVEGDISVAGRWLSDHRSDGDFDVSTLKEPYRVEGKKTMGYELFEQFGGTLPEVVIYPTGGGTGLVGMWKAFDEMEAMGWISSLRPRLVSVQAGGCAPIVKAFSEGHQDIVAWHDPMTAAWGLRVPSPIGGFLCLRAIAETGGSAIAVAEADLHRAALDASDETGIDFCPEGGAAWAAMTQLCESGVIGRDDRVVVWNTGSGASYRS